MYEQQSNTTSHPGHFASAPAAPAMSNARVHALDSVRAGAMLLGVVLHASVSLMASDQVDWPVRDLQRSPGFDVFTCFIHVFRMPLFFVVAGFFARLVHERLGTRGFAGHRYRRVLLPFLVTLVTLVPAIELVSVYATHPMQPAADWWLELRQHFSQPGLLAHFKTYHLWFLYYLLLLYVAVVPPILAGSRIVSREGQAKWDRFCRWLVSSWSKPLILGVPTTLLLSQMQTPTFDSPMALVPELRVLFSYQVFFVFGWILHRHADLLPALQQRSWLYLVVGFSAFPLYGVLVNLQLHGTPPIWAKLASSGAHAIVTWCFVFACLGLALKYLAAPNAAIRYVADSSYWVYLVHPPLVILIQSQLATAQLPGPLKLLVILSITVAITLLSYHFFVRATVVGQFLNGRKFPLPGRLQIRAPELPS